MAYEIYPIQEICNVVGKKKIIVETIDEVHDGYIIIGSYLLPFSKILYIKVV